MENYYVPRTLLGTQDPGSYWHLLKPWLGGLWQLPHLGVCCIPSSEEGRVSGQNILPISPGLHTQSSSGFWLPVLSCPSLGSPET